MITGHYARVGGISLVELNLLEKEFLDIIDWRLTCSGALLQHYYVSLVQSHKDFRLVEEISDEDEEDWDVLRRALKAEAERRGLAAPHRIDTEPD